MGKSRCHLGWILGVRLFIGCQHSTKTPNVGSALLVMLCLKRAATYLIIHRVTDQLLLVSITWTPPPNCG